MAKAQSPKPAKKPSSQESDRGGSKIDIRINLLSQVAQQLKTAGVVAALLSLPLALTFFLPSQQPTAYPVEPQVFPSPEVVSAGAWRCRFGGGEWRKFPNSCADFCGAQDEVCAQLITEGCECGEGQCWDGESCVLDSDTPTEAPVVVDDFPLVIDDLPSDL